MNRQKQYNTNYRIATTEAGLARGFFFTWNIPAPEFCIFRNYSTEVSKVDGGQSQHGFASVELSWPILTAKQAKTLRDFVEASLSSSGTGDLWLTVDLASNGNYAWGTWADVYGKPNRPKVTPKGNSSNLIFENFKLTINNVTIKNNPATGL